ncbi:InlB B-repeat-containing protein [Bifidobacterium pullorum]|uniref:InlB B-repeat-containing protein n=1 Tax=Bifidobacterium pullorum TaxID=78448 RepID=UPI0025A3199A|nr:InlB B-repeat-containing protein [Bifidobacterium pullorum]MDM8322792.1 InlB B-repeat-containing protein [Bifidobacterium pullorum]
MTGNNKVWRMPVAGLASVAMLATLGVTAMTANAAEVTRTVTLHANGGTFNPQTVGTQGVVSADGSTMVFETTATDTALPKTIDDALVDVIGAGVGPDYLYDEGATIATMEDNTFTGWYPAAAAGAAVSPDTVLDDDIDLYAHWSTNPVTVHFDGKGVSDNADVNVNQNDVIADWQVPGDLNSTDGRLVKGWASKYDASTVVDPAGMTAEELLENIKAGQSGVNNVSLEAVMYDADQVHTVKFTKSAKDLQFYVGQEYKGRNNYQFEVVEGTEINPPTARYEADKSMYVTAWRAENDKNNAVFPKTVNQDYVFKAVDNAHGYTVNFWYDYEEADSQLLSSTTVGEDEAVAKPADPTRDGYTFAGWVDKNGKAWNFKNNVTNANTKDGVLNLYATWKLAAASVKFHTNSDDVESVITKSFADGDKFEAPEVTRDGYVLDGWYSDASLTTEVTYFGRTLRLNATSDTASLEYAVSTAPGGNTGAVVTWQPVAAELWAKWIVADESAIKDQEAVTPARLLYEDSNPSKPFLSESKYFTTDSFNEFTDWYDSTYLPAKQAAQADGGFTRAEAAELVTMLKEAQSKLVFRTDVTVWRFEKDGQHIYAQGKEETDNLLADGWKHETFGDLHTVGVAGLPRATVDELLTKVSRLREKATGQYMLTADQNEIDALGDAWKNETFSALYAPKNGTTPVYRLYLKYNNEHLVTADANEYNTQIQNSDSFHGDGVKFYLY